MNRFAVAFLALVFERLFATLARHAERSERIRKAMRRGARLTDHRLKL